jgi:predicted nucleic acid-binding protein
VVVSARLLLDTSAYANFRRGHASVVEALATAEHVFMAAISLGELEAGFALGSRHRENETTLREFLAEPFVSVVAVDEAVAKRYATLFVQLRRAGTPIPTNDIWIAAAALHVGAELWTFDSDFEHVRDLRAHVLQP